MLRMGTSYNRIDVFNRNKEESVKAGTWHNRNKASHEETDTRIILHAIHSEANTIIISAQDTDVFLQLVAHCDKFQCDQLCMKSGTAKTIQ